MTVLGVLESAAGTVIALVAFSAGRRLLALPTWLVIKRRIDAHHKARAQGR